MTIHTTISVDLGERSYPIIVGTGLLGSDFDLSRYLAGSDCLVVSNDVVAPLYLEQLKANLGGRVIGEVILPDGEENKTPASIGAIIDRLVAVGANRDTTVVALGGGVAGDIAGFAAATYMRGVAFIQVPTTLLAQVDSSVGGKTGVNHPGGKNLIGAFHQPEVVVIDTATLDTLPDREVSAGLAEVIKHGAIADLEYLSWIEENIDALVDRDPAALAHAIARSCEIKAAVVAADEKERGQRALLNFGHTFGHAIENTVGYGEWLHGEAVAAGMVMAANLSGLGDDDVDRLRNLIAAARLPTTIDGIDVRELRTAMNLDKKVIGRKLRFVLLRSLGDAYVHDNVDEARLATVLSAASS